MSSHSVFLCTHAHHVPSVLISSLSLCSCVPQSLCSSFHVPQCSSNSVSPVRLSFCALLIPPVPCAPLIHCMYSPCASSFPVFPVLLSFPQCPPCSSHPLILYSTLSPVLLSFAVFPVTHPLCFSPQCSLCFLHIPCVPRQMACHMHDLSTIFLFLHLMQVIIQLQVRSMMRLWLN